MITGRVLFLALEHQIITFLFNVAPAPTTKYSFRNMPWFVTLYLQDLLSLTAGHPSRRHSGDIPDPTPSPRTST